MTKVREAQAQWHGNVDDGSGAIHISNGAFTGSYSKDTRFGDASGTNPEELVAAAQAGCYSMALAARMASEGYTPSTIDTTARVYLNMEGDVPHISTIDIITTAEVDDIRDEQFQQLAEAAKENCPISNLCAGAEIRLEAGHTAS